MNSLEPLIRPQCVLSCQPAPLDGEMLLKAWKYREAVRLGISASAVSMRYYRGKYPNLTVRHESQRTVWVKEQITEKGKVCTTQ